MENYINNFNNYDKSIIYDFIIGDGGIGDFVKFFMIMLADCMRNNMKIYHKKNNLPIESYIKFKYEFMNITPEEISKLDNYVIKKPNDYYNNDKYKDGIPLKEVFYFDDSVKLNVQNVIPFLPKKYISIHLRLGDKYLETDENFIVVKHDTRSYSEEKLYQFIEEHSSHNIIFFCDNNSFKLKVKDDYNHIFITKTEIGHTSLKNTTQKQTLDAITDFYLLSESEFIYAASFSGFSKMAADFNKIEIIY